MQSYNPRTARRSGLGSSLFARHYLGNHYYFLFLRVLRCFSSPGWLSFEWYIFNISGCPIRKSKDISLVCSSPRLIAAYHVLHRLSDPRHPPCALNCFKKFISMALAWGAYHYYSIWFCFPNMSKNYYQYYYRYLLMCWTWTNWFAWTNHTAYFLRTRLVWRISESNRWPSACKADALANWANPPYSIVVDPTRVELVTSTLSV